MAIRKLTIGESLPLLSAIPVIDVRSPGEYNHAHIPGAYNLPLFSDEERKQVGTAYKQQSREIAVKKGLDFFGVKMNSIIEEAEKIIENGKGENTKGKTVFIHCWRGGMRSAGIAWLLDLYGFKVYTLTGGYKAYRNWVLAQFERDYPFHVVGGYTGSGKTLVLHHLKEKNYPVLDLEGLANHKGSAFGALGQPSQPGQEMFENLLADHLFSLLEKIKKDPLQPSIFVEDESQRIGNLNMPIQLWKQMRNSPLFFLDIPFEERLDHITRDYGVFEKEKLSEAINRIQKRLGGLETKNAIRFLMEENTRGCFGILLTYYDKWYHKGLYNRENLSAILNKITVESVNTPINTEKLLSCIPVSV